ncbi:uncharacterized protein BDZ99DRAFT_513006 [Mytilinidion resinicola]|uniref:Prion-inhibition and propagation HeLo domain-containing protein n=1 Tax=Mytilinidion resinicola TaxID=574789 RepID=A0A6A6Z8V0_9PEZI|nr:uncharacterized protein BDZ99DRAFT_513006 [Mytilinidion resinicola]KAF2816724.1 hypothetical protein BDZ99DRAFT_513006 [Mytilinidion resinicola]
MEIAGLALGVASLAGLFSACTNGFALIRRGQALGKDFRILETKFSNQKLRLRAWGRACGFADDEAEKGEGDSVEAEKTYDERLNAPELKANLEETLECITMLLCDGVELRERYGLTPCSVDGASPASSRSDVAEKEKGNSLRDSATWAIGDRSKFAEMVSHLKDFIDDLENLTKYTDVPKRQMDFIGYEVECITDMETLEEVDMAREGEEDAVSDAASARLDVLSQAASSVRASFETRSLRTVDMRILTSFETRSLRSFGMRSLRSIITLESYVTARSRFSINSAMAAREDVGFSHTTVRSALETATKTEVTAGTGNFKPWLQIPETSEESMPLFKLVVTGPPGPIASRKTDLLTTFMEGSLPKVHVLTVFENHVMGCR